MTAVCFYFQVHQPYRLRQYSFFDIGGNPFYEDEDKNCEALLHIAKTSYLPMNDVLMHLIRKHKGQFKASFSISGTAIDLFAEHAPEVLDSFVELSKTGCVEFLCETDAHTLACMYSPQEFKRQIVAHRQRMEKLFGKQPTVFRNSELIYNNDVAYYAEELGFDAILSVGADHALGWRSPNYVYQPVGCSNIKLLLNNCPLTEDISQRFSQREWTNWPLTAEKYASWLHAQEGQGDVINLFMDYSTFGERHQAPSGIFEFMKALPTHVLKNPNFCFKTPSEVVAKAQPKAKLDITQYMSWADVERDINAWVGNDMQQDALNSLYALESTVEGCTNANLLRMWQHLQSSDHFCHMCTKWFADATQEAMYQNPYPTPYDAYINFMNVLADFSMRLNEAPPSPNLLGPTALNAAAGSQGSAKTAPKAPATAESAKASSGKTEAAKADSETKSLAKSPAAKAAGAKAATAKATKGVKPKSAPPAAEQAGAKTGNRSRTRPAH